MATSNVTPGFPGKLNANSAPSAGNGHSSGGGAVSGAVSGAGSGSGSGGVKLGSGFAGSIPSGLAAKLAATEKAQNQVVADTSVVPKLTESGSEQAKAGVSMADMIKAQIAAALAEVLPAMMGNVPPQSNPVKAAPKAKPAVSGGKLSAKAATAKLDDREKFDPRVYFSLGAPMATFATATGPAYIAKSDNPDYERNPYAIVGIQRKTIMLSEAGVVNLAKLLSQVVES